MTNEGLYCFFFFRMGFNPYSLFILIPKLFTITERYSTTFYMLREDSFDTNNLGFHAVILDQGDIMGFNVSSNNKMQHQHVIIG